MARPAQITRENLAPLIRARGPVSATELATLLRVNRTTIARTLPDFGDELVTLGATRSTRYLLRRGIRNIGNRWRIYRLDAAGGEQPKFLTTLRDETGGFHPVLVKFSAPMDQPTGQRWADLLLCEFHGSTGSGRVGGVV